jgi:hypothetical protein
MQFSRTRLSDIVHRPACAVALRPRPGGPGSVPPVTGRGDANARRRAPVGRSARWCRGHWGGRDDGVGYFLSSAVGAERRNVARTLGNGTPLRRGWSLNAGRRPLPAGRERPAPAGRRMDNVLRARGSWCLWCLSGGCGRLGRREDVVLEPRQAHDGAEQDKGGQGREEQGVHGSCLSSDACQANGAKESCPQSALRGRPGLESRGDGEISSLAFLRSGPVLAVPAAG